MMPVGRAKKQGWASRMLLRGGAGGGSYDVGVAAGGGRWAGEMERLDKQPQAVTARVENETFTARAPAEVVERERRKEQTWQDQRDTLAVKRRSLGC